MPTPIVITLVAAYVASAAVLFVFAGFGFRQQTIERVIEAAAGLVCLWQAVALPFADRPTLWTLVWLAAPVVALAEVLRLRRAAQLHDEQLAATYAAEAQDRQT